MRNITLLALALTLNSMASSSLPTALQIVGCQALVWTVNVANPATSLKSIPGIEATKDGCAVEHLLAVAGNRVALLIRTQRTVTEDAKTSYELQLYSVPSWKLEAKQALPGRLPDQSYIIPSDDGLAVVAISMSEEESSGHAFLAFHAADLKTIPVASTKPLDLLTPNYLDSVLEGDNGDDLRSQEKKGMTSKTISDFPSRKYPA